jgi:hypothetical protein
MLRFSGHAKRRMVERNVSEEEVQAVYEEPDVTYPDATGNRCYVRQMGERSLRIVLAKDDPDFVITVIDRSN